MYSERNLDLAFLDPGPCLPIPPCRSPWTRPGSSTTGGN